MQKGLKHEKNKQQHSSSEDFSDKHKHNQTRGTAQRKCSVLDKATKTFKTEGRSTQQSQQKLQTLQTHTHTQV